MSLPCPCDLAGLGVLVTRPAHQATGLCRRIDACGGRPLVVPAMEILPPSDPAPARALLGRKWDIAIYISANAAQFAAALAVDGTLPPARHTAAVGRATARILDQLGICPDLVPVRFDSEGLLALPELNRVAGADILIVRGEGGRPLLGDTLGERGARVHYAEVYRRALPQWDPQPLLARWERDVQAVTATSPEVVDNLLTVLGALGRQRLCDTPLVVISERMAQTARALGVQRVERAAGADDESLVQALCAIGAGP
jgi:uroporphyrinogen-III synthase